MPERGAAAGDRWIERGGLAVRYRLLAGSGGARAVLLPGFTEFIEKHEGALDRLGAMGLDRFAIDWPGQGLSGRLSPGHPDLVHCDSFDRHLDALGAALGDAGFLDGGGPLLLIGHSMGGHLALRMLERLPGAAVAGVVLCSPMMMPPAPPMAPPGLLLALSAALCRLGLAARPLPGRRRMPRGGEFRPGNPLTRNPEGYRVQPDWWERNPDLLAHGPSIGWVRAAYASCLATTGDPDWLGRIAVPVQAHLAGDEAVVSARHSEALLPRIPDAAVHRYEGARHELLMELPEAAEPLWERVGAFISGLAGAGG